jgi:hypothetical protein
MTTSFWPPDDDGTGGGVVVIQGTVPWIVNGSGFLQPVSFVPAYSVYNYFSSISSVPNSVLSTILSFTASSDTYLGEIETSGTNIAEFRVYLNSVLISKQRTHFGWGLNLLFKYSFDLELGLKMVSGDLLEVKVIQTRPTLGDYEARLLYAK